MRHSTVLAAAAFALLADGKITAEIIKAFGPPFRAGDSRIIHEVDDLENYNYSGRELELPILTAEYNHKGLKQGFALVSYGSPSLFESQLPVPFPPEEKSEAMAADTTEVTDLKELPEFLQGDDDKSKSEKATSGRSSRRGATA